MQANAVSFVRIDGCLRVCPLTRSQVSLQGGAQGTLSRALRHPAPNSDLVSKQESGPPHVTLSAPVSKGLSAGMGKGGLSAGMGKGLTGRLAAQSQQESEQCSKYGPLAHVDLHNRVHRLEASPSLSWHCNLSISFHNQAGTSAIRHRPPATRACVSRGRAKAADVASHGCFTCSAANGAITSSVFTQTAQPPTACCGRHFHLPMCRGAQKPGHQRRGLEA